MDGGGYVNQAHDNEYLDDFQLCLSKSGGFIIKFDRIFYFYNPKEGTVKETAKDLCLIAAHVMATTEHIEDPGIKSIIVDGFLELLTAQGCHV